MAQLIGINPKNVSESMSWDAFKAQHQAAINGDGKARATSKIADQEETERRTYYSQAMHEEFLDAGFYDLYVPRRYGGLELGVPAYVRVIQEVARGCVSTAWCVGL